MFRTQLNELRNLGNQFAQAFTNLAETTADKADDEVAIIYGAMERLDQIACTQTALLETAQSIINAMEQVREPLSNSLARNEVVLDNLDAMDSDLCIVNEDDEGDEDDNETDIDDSEEDGE